MPWLDGVLHQRAGPGTGRDRNTWASRCGDAGVDAPLDLEAVARSATTPRRRKRGEHDLHLFAHRDGHPESCCSRLPRRKRASRAVARGTARGSMSDRAAMVFRALNRKCTGSIRALEGPGLRSSPPPAPDSSRAADLGHDLEDQARLPAPLIKAVWASMLSDSGGRFRRNRVRRIPRRGRNAGEGGRDRLDQQGGSRPVQVVAQVRAAKNRRWAAAMTEVRSSRRGPALPVATP